MDGVAHADDAVIGELILLLDRDGTYLQVVSTTPGLLHQPAEELLGRRLHEVLPAADADAFLAVIHDALATGGPVRIDYELPVDGRTASFEAVAAPIAADRVVWVSRDVSGQRLAEAAARASEERYRLLFNSNPMPMWVYDRATLRFLAVNEAAVRQYGYSADEFLAMTIADIRPPGDLERLRASVADSPGQLHRRPGWVHRRRDGTLIDIDIVAHPLQFEGHDAKLVLALDVTATRRAERERRAATEVVRAVVDDSPLAIISMDLEVRITGWNRAAEQLLGWSEDAVMGRDAGLILPGDARAEEHRAREEALRTGTSHTYETRRRRSDGALVDVSVSLGALHDEAGDIAGFVAILADITDRRLLEQRLLQSQKMEAVGQLAGGIAHDFNNLLTAIGSYTQFLLDDSDAADPRQSDLLEIRRAADRAASLTRQLLAFSRQQVVQPRVLSVNAIVVELKNMLRRLVRESIDVQLRLDPAVGAIEADRGQIEQVLVNLVLNARDACPDGGTILIETSNEEYDVAPVRGRGHAAIPAGRFVALSVTDNGAGMSEEVQARIFEPFFTTKEPGEGTGLGLATVYGIVQQAKGVISVYSEEGHGARFRILLPRVDAPAPASGPPAEEALPRGRETVLIVEDDMAVRAVTSRILKRQGYTIIEAHGGEDALMVFESAAASIDLVVTDMVMPDMSGTQLAELLRQRDPALRILLMSGYSRDAATRLTRLAPGMAYLEKPFTPHRLASRVRALLDTAGAHD